MKKMFKLFPLALLSLLVLVPQNLPAQGQWEFGIHYSLWSIDILRGVIEDAVGDVMEENLKDRFLDEIQRDFPNLEETYYNQEVEFDSGGHNYGFEIRWYPAGKNGSYSMGLSIEKTYMRVSFPEVSATMTLEDQLTNETGTFQGNISEALFELRPLSFHLSFRWDINPSWKWRPYITFGVGMAGAGAIDNGEYSVAWSGRLDINGDESYYEGTDAKTLEELRTELEEDDEDFPFPGFLPFIQLNFGLKGEVYDNLYVLFDIGVWDGLLFRLGVAYRL